MLARLARFVLKIFGWKVIDRLPHHYRKYVLIMAPHTSNWDFVIGRLALWSLHVKAHFLIKKEAFLFPLGPLLKAMGGIPVDRSHSNNVVHDIAQKFRKSDLLVIVITPEGTRSLRHEWKRGFWFIARAAQVPIAMAYLDYKKREAGVGSHFMPSDNYQSDLATIYDFYKDKNARHPERFNLSPQVRNALDQSKQ